LNASPILRATEGFSRRALLAMPALAHAAPPWPRVLVDGLGRRVEIAAPPQRIAAIFASNVEMLAGLGLVDRIAAIEAYTRFPPEVAGKPLVGGRLGFSAEAIARLGCDLAVMTPARGAAHLLTEPLARIGIPTLVVIHRDLPGVFGNIALLGRATGTEEPAEALADRLRARLGALSARLAGRPPVSLFLETSSNGRGAFGTARPRSYTQDILLRAGGAPVFPDLPDAAPAQVSGEAILRADPAVYLLAGRPDQAAEVLGRPGYAGLRAVRQGRVHPVSRSGLLIPGPRVVEGAEQVARLLHPEAFG
jgi:iron complex transport system substrate-binding protein